MSNVERLGATSLRRARGHIPKKHIRCPGFSGVYKYLRRCSVLFARVLARHIITRCYLSGFSFSGERSEFSGRHFLDAPSRARRLFSLGHIGPLMVKIPSVLGEQCRALNAVLPVSHAFFSIFKQSRASESVPRLPSFDSTFQLQNKKSILLCLIGLLCF